MPKKRKSNPPPLKLWRARKKHVSVSRRIGAWQLIFVLFLVLVIPLFVFVMLQSSRSQQVLGTSSAEKGGE